MGIRRTIVVTCDSCIRPITTGEIIDLTDEGIVLHYRCAQEMTVIDLLNQRGEKVQRTMTLRDFLNREGVGENG